MNLSNFVQVFDASNLRIGDEVIFYLSEEDREWRTDLPENYTKGVVTGFYEYLTSNHHGSSNPGIFVCNGAARITMSDGKSHLGLNGLYIPKEIYEVRKEDITYRKAFEQKVKISDLPDLGFMVGNEITIKSRFGETDIPATVTDVDYTPIVSRRTGGLKHTLNWDNLNFITVKLKETGSTYISPADIGKITNKGNVWAYHNDKTQLIFKDLNEESSFYRKLGLMTEIRNPVTQKYKWTIEEAVQAVRDGIANCIGVSVRPFTFNPHPDVVVYKCDDQLPEDFKERLIKETLEGFKDI